MRKVVLLLIMLSAVLAFGCKEKKKSGEKWVEKTETFYAVADATVYEEPTFANSNYGSEQTCEVGYDLGYLEGTFVKWDLSSIPTNAQILEVKIVLKISDVDNIVGNNFVFWVYKVGAPWDEATVTWNNMPSASFDPIDVFNGPSGTGHYEVDFTNSPDTVAMIEGWVKNPSNNHGIYIDPDWQASQGDSHMEFSSKEGGNAPALIIKYRYQQ